MRKAWHQLKPGGFDVARCTAARLVEQIGLLGAERGRGIKTTRGDTSAPCPQAKVNRPFPAPVPSMLWARGVTSVSTGAGFENGAFVIDAFANRIVGWRVSGPLRTDFFSPL